MYSDIKWLGLFAVDCTESTVSCRMCVFVAGSTVSLEDMWLTEYQLVHLTASVGHFLRSQAATLSIHDEQLDELWHLTPGDLASCLENLEMSGILTAVREMSGILLNVMEMSGTKSCQGKMAKNCLLLVEWVRLQLSYLSSYLLCIVYRIPFSINVRLGRQTFPVTRLTFSCWLTTYVGKPSTGGHPTRSTQPFIH